MFAEEADSASRMPIPLWGGFGELYPMSDEAGSVSGEEEEEEAACDVSDEEEEVSDEEEEEEAASDNPWEMKMLHVGQAPKVGFACINKTTLMALVVDWQLKEHKLDVKVRHSNSPNKMILGCAANECSLRINAVKVGKGPMWKFTKIKQEHNCNGTVHRQRGYNTDTIFALRKTSVLQFCAQKNSHDATALIKTVNSAADGFRIGQTVARNILSVLGGVQNLDYFTQFAHLPGFVTALTEFDKDGHYELKTTNEPNNNRFVSLYLASGWSKKMWLLLRKSWTYDGAKVKTVIEGCLMNVVALGANNNLVVLALFYCDTENAKNATYLMKLVLADYPPPVDGKILVYQDAGPALITGCIKNGLDWRRCCHHAVCKCRTTLGLLPGDLEMLLYSWFRCTTPAEAERLEAQMRRLFPSQGKHIDWMVERKEKLVSTYFIDSGFISLEQITNNPSEQFFEFVDSVRDEPVISMFISISKKCAEKLSEERALAFAREAKRHINGNVSQYDLVPEAVKELLVRSALVTGKAVIITFQSATKLSGTVTLSKTAVARVELTLDLAIGTVRCTYCRVHEDTGLLCACSIALIAASNAIRSAFSSSFSIYDVRLAHPQRHTATWVEQCALELPLCPYSVPQGQLEKTANTLLPWPKPPPKGGRPKKVVHRKEQNPLKRNSYYCSGCNLEGHSIRKCENVNLDHLRTVWETRHSVKRKDLGAAKNDRYSNHPLTGTPTTL